MNTEGAFVGLARHDLLLVSAKNWPTVLGEHLRSPALSLDQAGLIARWGDAGWPVIARRAAVGHDPGAVPVGLPLPPSLGKLRLALSIPPGVSWRAVDAIGLAKARECVPTSWDHTVDAVITLGRSLGLTPHVFGALLWQSLTGMAYLTSASDLDLLWRVEDATALPPLLEGLARIEATGPMRIDGEILTAAGGVNWRELGAALRGETDVVLMKSMTSARFVEAPLILAGEGVPCC